MSMQMEMVDDRILVIDDNEAIHNDFQKILCSSKSSRTYDDLDASIFGESQSQNAVRPEFHLEFASQGKDGLELIKQSVTDNLPYHLAFVDIRMPPGWDGVHTATEILKVDPNIQIVFCTAFSDYATDDILNHFGLADNIVILRKPFDASEVELLAVALNQKWKATDALTRVTKTQSDTLTRAARMVNEIQAENRTLLSERQRINDDSQSLAKQLELTASRLEETEDFALFAMAKVVEARDVETGEHIHRMQAYAQLIAERLAEHGPYADQITEQFLHDLYRSTPLHDIGKVSVPDGILLKPGKLTEAEHAMMMQHASIGSELLMQTAQHHMYGEFLKMAADIALSHHERWDGEGYPNQLAGTEIPLSARISAVADSFDAMTSNRVYSDAKPDAVARDIVRSERGKQFDPHVADAFDAIFVDICDAKLRINNQASEQ